MCGGSRWWHRSGVSEARDERHATKPQVIELFLRDFRVADITRIIAREAIDLRRTRRIRLPDALIWAAARSESALLVTRNTKDFPRDDPGVRVPY
jgi:predicted nucleic acid-binding protein